MLKTAVFFIIQILSILTESSYTEREIEIVKELGSFYSARNFVFLESEKNWKMAKLMRNFSDGKFFTSVMDSNRLSEILEDDGEQEKFFPERNLLITKEILNFTDFIQKTLLPDSFVWAIFVDSLNEIENNYISPRTNFFLIRSFTDELIVDRVYSVKKNDDLRVKNFMIRSGNRQTSDFVDKNEEIKKIDFENVTLRTLVHVQPTDKTTNWAQQLAIYKLRMFQTELIEILSRTLNFNVNIVKPLQLDYPYFYDNGSVTEVFFLLQRRELDISGCSYIVNNERKKIYDFAWPTFSFRSMLYIKSNPGESFWQAYIKPLDSKIHYAILTWIFLSGIIIHVFQMLRSRNFKFEISLAFRSVLKSLQILCNQGVPNMSRWCSDRLVYMLTFLLVLLIYQYYSAKLISSLTVVAPRIPFFTFDDFIRDGSYMVMTLTQGFHKIVFTKYLKGLGMGHFLTDNSSFPKDAQEAISKLCMNDKLAYIEFRENIVRYDLDCKITEIPKPVFSYHFGLGLQKNSPYKTFVNQEITKFLGNGIINRMRRQLLRYEKLKDSQEEEYVSVTLEQVLFPFIILMVGVFISVTIFLGEVYWWKIFCKER